MFAVDMALALSADVGCRLLTVDAYPQSMQFYERLGFTRNKAKDRPDGKPISMRLDLRADPAPSWLTSG